MRTLAGFLLLASLFVIHPAPASADTGCKVKGSGAGLHLKGEQHQVLVVPNPAAAKIGEQFSLTISPCTAKANVILSKINATMPMHGHGMNYRPTITPDGKGNFRVDGMLFHMPGTWRLILETRADGRREKLTSDFLVKP